MSAYDHKKIEKKWQEYWANNKIYTTPDSVPGKDNFYLLVEFPYPSGNLHVGHWYAFAIPDILARAMRMQGKNVMYPIGFDAFGLPAENAAIKNNLNPRDWTEKNIAYMKKQIESMGTTFDWSREVSTIDPAYYKWTQWLFLQLYKKGLVYRKETAVNWCPTDKTVLANEQVVDGRCERCGSEVVQKQMLQWNIKITDYADRLIDDLAALDWPEQIKESQRNWIGRSVGAEVDFPLDIDPLRHVVFLHCKGGSPEDDFIPWAKAELKKRGYTVEAPALPNASEPDDVEQAEYALTHSKIDENTILVGHSSGGLAALRIAEKRAVGRLVLVGTPYDPVFSDGKERATVSRSIERGYDFDAIKKNAGGVLALYDEGDHIIKLSEGESYAGKLGGLFIRGKGIESHFNGKREPDVLMAATPSIRVFTTRPDTLFGATYLVLAPEHPWLSKALQNDGDTISIIKNREEVQKYVTAASKKTELERQTEQKDKTGVKLEGVEAVNPATGEKIPLYVADYVLGHYGTGAIMAVPAHDERDYEFAKKFSLPIKEVVEPLVVGKTGDDAVREGLPFKERNAAVAVIKHWSEDKYLCLAWKQTSWKGFVVGGLENGEDAVQAAIREIREETGYTNPKFERKLGGTVHCKFYHVIKQDNRFAHFTPLLFHLESGDRDEIAEREKELHDIHWVDTKAVDQFINSRDIRIIWDRVKNEIPYTGDGVLVRSGDFSGQESDTARKQMAERYGRLKKTYRLRDWIVSRQRYWGVPIPMIHCEKCGAQPVPDDQLPVELPVVEDYLPDGKGKSPLAKVSSFVETSCPKCGGKAERETDTLDTFVDSSWYFLRYTDPKNGEEFASRQKQDNWMPIDLYSGGAEHTTMHVLYSRFWQKALFDMGLVADPEPYTRRMNRSLILGPDGQKMSKSRGNVIDPDEVVALFGADTVRMYLAFIGPYNEVSNYPWNPDSVVGVRRFLERAWKLSERLSEGEGSESALHRAIKKVSEDIPKLKFNTAISALMILINEAEKKGMNKDQFGRFLRVLAPFAPHMAEELWSELGNKESVHVQAWPSYDEIHLLDEAVTVAIQIDGKTRGEVSVPADADKAAMESAAREAVAARLEGTKVARVVVVPKRLVNFVLEH